MNTELYGLKSFGILLKKICLGKFIVTATEMKKTCLSSSKIITSRFSVNFQVKYEKIDPNSMQT